MSIFSRTRDIIAANMTDLLAKSEDPAKTIRVMIMEMEETLVEVRAAAARNIADKKELLGQMTRLEALKDNWTEKAELALSKGREDLARAALGEKRKVGEMTDALSDEVSAIQETLRASEGDIARLQARLREARSRQCMVATRLETAQNKMKMRQAYAGERAEEAFANFDILERRADYAEGQADALLLAMPPKSLEEQIADLRNAEMIDAELEAMKAARLKAA
jgi:phage shock protein A